MNPYIAALAAAASVTVVIRTANADSPSFDCGKARSEVESLVCGDAQLAQLDREVGRLYDLGSMTKRISPPLRKQLIATQRGWIEGRDACSKAQDERGCARDAYLIRIHELRQGYPQTRRADGWGISLGPVAVQCDRMEAAAMTYVRSEPGLAYLAGKDVTLVLTAAPSGSGARYAARLGQGEAVFWIKGNDATFEVPGEPARHCTLMPRG